MKTAFFAIDEPGALGEAGGRYLLQVPRFDVDIAVFREVPRSPFAYWVSPAVLEMYRSQPATEDQGRVVRTGLASNEDFRWIRLWWEAKHHPDNVVFAKGGGFARYYADLHLVIRWGAEGEELKVSKRERFRRGELTENNSKIWNQSYYFRPGVTYSARTQSGFSARIMAAGGLFGHKGPAVFSETDATPSLLATCAVVNSAPFRALLSLQAIFGSYEIGMLKVTPFVRLEEMSQVELGGRSRSCWSIRRNLDTATEVSHAFVVPAVLQVAGDGFESRVSAWAARVSGAESELARVQSEIDELCFELYGISDEDQRAITEGFGVSDSDEAEGDSGDEDEAESGVVLDPAGLAAGLVSWAVGVAVGRFDVRRATGERGWPVEPDPFDPLPVCSPGMLTGDHGLPLSSSPDGYPVVPSPVLVDDAGHDLDLTARVRAVFDVVFSDHADVWWSNVGAALDSRNGVEGWLRRGFFDQHLKTYSMSRRKAPVMWPIGTRTGSYRVWLYAHQVTGDTLFRVLGDVVEPKLASEQRRLSDLMQEFGPSPSASQRRTLNAQQALVDELIELRDELRAVAPLWHPDLNDGIVIALAPLWRLFAHHRAWSKELRDGWVRLANGEYDWAQLAMHIWPERVIPKCAEDRSLAIAHDLEDTFWAKDDDNPDKWHARHTPTTPIAQHIANRTNPTVQTARTHPTS